MPCLSSWYCQGFRLQHFLERTLSTFLVLSLYLFVFCFCFYAFFIFIFSLLIFSLFFSFPFYFLLMFFLYPTIFLLPLACPDVQLKTFFLYIYSRYTMFRQLQEYITVTPHYTLCCAQHKRSFHLLPYHPMSRPLTIFSPLYIVFQ